MLRKIASAGKRPALTPLSTNTTVGLSKKRSLPADEDEVIDTPTKKPAKRRAKKQEDNDDHHDHFEPTGSPTRPEKKGNSSQPVLSEEVESDGDVVLGDKGDVSEDEDVEELVTGHAAEPSEPAIDGTKKKRAERRPGITLEFNLESFKVLNIGKPGPVHREQLTWWLATSEEEVWKLTQLAYTEERQRVLGGTFLGLYKFTDLPRSTHEEMEMWQVYGDMLDTYGRLDKLYGGSGSANMAAHGTYSRWHYYERCMRRFLGDISVELDTKHSEHLRHALRPGVTMNIRTCAVLDPQKHSQVEIITLEGLFIDVMQTFDRQYIPKGLRNFDNVEVRDASIAASDGDMTWKGLNQSTCFTQALQKKSGPADDPSAVAKASLLKAQNWECELCHKCDDKRNKNWVGTNGKQISRVPLQNTFICKKCYGRVINYWKDPLSERNLEAFKAARSGRPYYPVVTWKTALRKRVNRKPDRPKGVSTWTLQAAPADPSAPRDPEEPHAKFNLMVEQDKCCPFCLRDCFKDIDTPSDATSDIGTVYMNLAVCKPCRLWVEIMLSLETLTEASFIAELTARRKKLADSESPYALQVATNLSLDHVDRFTLKKSPPTTTKRVDRPASKESPPTNIDPVDCPASKKSKSRRVTIDHVDRHEPDTRLQSSYTPTGMPYRRLLPKPSL
ncbi:unnamed protein product [Zymoseptoria tritici ST99CH_1A5]|uniref:Uncharacterized protein n=1 Tax=Zymoseptoria tritici ST99CH_1A5 TaxID=1276529 RepID=A0A1Y6LKM3_ZYMTR|nr:unnamed protein product [Zymoseptoria tritici ST99CH_1A5]